MYEQLLEQLEAIKKSAIASANYYKDKSLADTNYHQGRRDNSIEVMNIIKRLTGEVE